MTSHAHEPSTVNDYMHQAESTFDSVRAMLAEECRRQMHVVLQMDRHVRVPEVGEQWWVLVTRSRGGPATGRCGGHAQVSRQAKHYAHRGINALMSCDKAFQDPCHSETRERKYVQKHIRICTHGVKTGLG